MARLHSDSKQKEDGGRKKGVAGSSLHRSLSETRCRVLKRVRLVSSANTKFLLPFTRIICPFTVPPKKYILHAKIIIINETRKATTLRLGSLSIADLFWKWKRRRKQKKGKLTSSFTTFASNLSRRDLYACVWGFLHLTKSHFYYILHLTKCQIEKRFSCERTIPIFS